MHIAPWCSGEDCSDQAFEIQCCKKKVCWKSYYGYLTESKDIEITAEQPVAPCPLKCKLPPMAVEDLRELLEKSESSIESAKGVYDFYRTRGWNALADTQKQKQKQAVAVHTQVIERQETPTPQGDDLDDICLYCLHPRSECPSVLPLFEMPCCKEKICATFLKEHLEQNVGKADYTGMIESPCPNKVCKGLLFNVNDIGPYKRKFTDVTLKARFTKLCLAVIKVDTCPKGHHLTFRFPCVVYRCTNCDVNYCRKCSKPTNSTECSDCFKYIKLIFQNLEKSTMQDLDTMGEFPGQVYDRRVCPKCYALIRHKSGVCKFLQCGACRTVFCAVCLTLGFEKCGKDHYSTACGLKPIQKPPTELDY